MNGETLKLLRTFYGYKSVEMAQMIGISQSYLSEIENNKKQPSLEILDKYAEAFDMKVSTILLFSESLEKDDLLQKNNTTKLKVARAGIKLLRLLERMGDFEDE